MHTDLTDLTDLCSQRGAHWGLEHEIFLNTNNANDTNIICTRILLCFLTHTDLTDLVRGGALTAIGTRDYYEHE